MKLLAKYKGPWPYLAEKEFQLPRNIKLECRKEYDVDVFSTEKKEKQTRKWECSKDNYSHHFAKAVLLMNKPFRMKHLRVSENSKRQGKRTLRCPVSKIIKRNTHSHTHTHNFLVA